MPKRKAKILIVDDAQINRIILCELLRDQYQILEAEDGKKALEIMKEDIKVCKSLGAKGVVLGVLTADNKVDFETLKELVDLASPMEVTFHKAVDELENPVEVIDRFVEIGVKRILSSGTKETALEGKDILNAMIKKADNRIIILIAGKVTSDNFEEVAVAIPSTEYHGKKII